MKNTLILCALLTTALGRPEGYYQQQYQYKSSAASYKNNELEHKKDDEGYYAKQGDLDGRTEPKVDAYGNHLEYTNPKFQNQNPSNDFYLQQTSGLGQHNRLSGYGDSTNQNTLAGQTGAASSYHRQSGYSASASFSSGNVGGVGAQSSADLTSLSQRLQTDLSRQLQQAISEQQRHSSSSGSTGYQNNNYQILEQELRNNLTLQLQQGLNQYSQQNQQYGQTHTNQYSYNSQEVEQLRRQLEEQLRRQLQNSMQSQTSSQSSHSVSTSSQTGYNANTGNSGYNPIHLTPDSYNRNPTGQATPLQPYNTNNRPRTISLTDVSHFVEPTALNEVDEAVTNTIARYTQQSGRSPINYQTDLNYLIEELKRNLTRQLNYELDRNYGRQEQRGSHYYTISANNMEQSQPNYRVEDLENIRQQLENRLVQQLNAKFIQQYNQYVSTSSHTSYNHNTGNSGYNPTHLTPDSHRNPTPLPAYNTYNYPATISLTDVSHLVETTTLNEVDDAVTNAISKYSQPNGRSSINYQTDLNYLTDELKRNLTRQFDYELVKNYGRQELRGSYYYTITANNLQQSQPNYRIDDLENTRQQLETRLVQQLNEKFRQQYNHYLTYAQRSTQQQTSNNNNYYTQPPTNYGIKTSRGRVHVANAQDTTGMMRTYPTHSETRVYPQNPQITGAGTHTTYQYIGTPTITRFTVRGDVPAELRVISSDVQADLARQLQIALQEQERKYQRQNSYAQSSSYNTQAYNDAILQQLTDELKQNLTQHLQQSINQRYGNQAQRGSQYFSIATSGGYSSSPNYNSQQLDDLTQQLQNNLITQLQTGLQQQQYSSSSSSSNSNYRAYRSGGASYTSGYNPTSSQIVYGSDEPDCDNMQGDDPSAYHGNNGKQDLHERLIFSNNKYSDDSDDQQQKVEDAKFQFRTYGGQRQAGFAANQNLAIETQNPISYTSSLQIGSLQNSGKFTGYGQQQVDLDQQDEDDLTQQVEDSHGKLQVGYGGQQQIDFGQQEEDLTQQVEDSHGKLQVGGYGQQQIDLNQQEEDLTQQVENSHEKLQFGGFGQQQIDLSQQEDDLTQQVEDSRGKLQFGGFGQQQMDLSQQEDDLTQQVEDTRGKLQVGYGGQQQIDFSQQEDDLTQQVEDSHGKLQVGGFGQQQINVGQQEYDLNQQTEDSSEKLQVGQSQLELGQQEEDLNQQVEGSYGKLQFGQQQIDLGQQEEEVQVSHGKLQFGGFGQQQIDLNQQEDDLTQQVEGSHGKLQVGQQQIDLGQQEEEVQVSHGKLQFGGFGQQQIDLNQQEDDLTQQVEDSHGKLQVGYGGQQQIDLGQQEEDLTQQVEESNGKLQFGGFGQQQIDLNQQEDDLTQQVEDSHGKLQIGYGGQQKIDLGQQEEDLTQQVEDSHGKLQFGQQQIDLSQQEDDLTQQVEDSQGKLQGGYGGQRQIDLGQQEEDLTQQVEDSHGKLQFGQQQIDLSQQEDDLTQQVEDSHGKLQGGYGGQRQIDFGQQQEEDLTQQVEDSHGKLQFGQQQIDLSQQEDDLTQQVEDLHGKLQVGYGQIQINSGQHQIDLNQEEDDLTQNIEDSHGQMVFINDQQQEDLSQQIENGKEKLSVGSQVNMQVPTLEMEFNKPNPGVYAQQEMGSYGQVHIGSTQQTQIHLNQKKDDLTQQVVDSHDNVQIQGYKQNNDSTQQTQESNGQFQIGSYGQQQVDLTQQEDLTQQIEDGQSQLNINNIGQNQQTENNFSNLQFGQDLTQQTEDVGKLGIENHEAPQQTSHFEVGGNGQQKNTNGQTDITQQIETQSEFGGGNVGHNQEHLHGIDQQVTGIFGGNQNYHGGSASYGHGGSSYGHGGSSYGHGGSSYGYGGSLYGHGSSSYGNGGSSYGNGGSLYQTEGYHSSQHRQLGYHSSSSGYSHNYGQTQHQSENIQPNQIAPITVDDDIERKNAALLESLSRLYPIANEDKIEKQTTYVTGGANVKTSYGAASSSYGSYVPPQQIQVEATHNDIVQNAEVEEITLAPTTTEKPGFWSNLGGKIKNTYEKAKDKAGELIEKVESRIG